MRKLVGAVAACMVAVTPLGLGGVTPAGAQGSEPTISKRDCGVLPAIDVQVTCLWLTVPEGRDSGTDTTIRLAVAVMSSRSASPEPDPVVFLSGGPGDAALDGLENFATSPLLENRDLILFDQRGTGISEPSLDCPEREEAAIADLGRAQPHGKELDAIRAALAACRTRLIDQGVDLDAYNTEESSADVADLRAALGIDEWNLYAVSYGTRLALATMRAHPVGIRTAVLDSVYPPDIGGLARQVADADRAIERFFAACAAEDGCNAAHPALEETFRALVGQRNAEPFTATVDAGSPVGQVAITLTGDDLTTALYLALYDTALIPAIPSVIEALAAGDVEALLAPLAQGAITAITAPSEGVYLSVECADAARFAGSRRDASLIEDPGRNATFVRNSALTYCDGWDVDPLPKSFSRAVRSPIPTLVLAGSLDPVTPASDSRRVARQLRNAQYVEMKGYGHGVTNGTDCPRAIRQAFLDDPDAELDTSCAASTGPIFGS